MNRRFTSAALGFAGLLVWLAPMPLHAQDYPVKPIRFLVGFPPGSSTDIVSRLLAQKLQERLGQALVVGRRANRRGT